MGNNIGSKWLYPFTCSIILSGTPGINLWKFSACLQPLSLVGCATIISDVKAHLGSRKSKGTPRVNDIKFFLFIFYHMELYQSPGKTDPFYVLLSSSPCKIIGYSGPLYNSNCRCAKFTISMPIKKLYNFRFARA